MAEKDKIFESKIKQTGIFDFKETYRFAYTWLVDNGYDVMENVYSEKVAGGAKEIEIEWVAERKVSDYFKFEIKANWRILAMTDVEVEENGKKVKMNKGQVEIKAKGTLIKDWEAKWEGQPIWKFFRGVYDKYIIRARIEQYEGKIFGEADEFLSQIKSFLAIEGMH